MSRSPLLELAARRGALEARSALQRDALAARSWSLEKPLRMADRFAGGLRWFKSHPALWAGAALALVVARPRRTWLWSQRALVLWRAWGAVRRRVW